MKPLVSIIIVTWNRKQDLKECLKSVKNQDYENKEVIVIDNNSTDNSVEMIEKEFPDVSLIKNKKNTYPPYARNQGIKISKGKYVWFLDNDAVVLKKTCLSNMVDILENTNNIGIVGGIAVFKNNKIVSVEARYINKDGRGVLKLVPIKNVPVYLTHTITANCFTRKDLVEKIGGFDPHYGYGSEDKDLGLKIQRLGYKNIITKDTLVLHKMALSKRMNIQFRNNKTRIRFILINYGILRILSLPLLDIKYLLNPKNIEKVENKYRTKNIKNIIKEGFNITSGMLLGYLWNIIYLPQTLYIKIKKPNFLK